jgi:hypothetical protein
MITPCCNKKCSEDEIWNAISDSGDNFSSTSKSISCPFCEKALIVYLSIESVEVDEE